MPVDIHPEHKISGIELILCKLHAGAKFSGNEYNFSGGLHGVGVSVVNALSQNLEAKIKRDAKEHLITFSNGDKVNDLSVIGEVGARNTGSSIKFKPNKDYFETDKVDTKSLIKLIKAKAVLCPGLTIEFYEEKKFLNKVKEVVKKNGFCVIVASEGIKNSKNKFVAESDTKDAFGHVQLGGVAPKLASLISNKLNLKNHWAVADYLQRSGRHIASLTDLEHASAVGKKAVEYAVKGLNGVMPIIVRKKTKRYSWEIKPAPLSKIANLEKKLPASFISKDGFNVTPKAIKYLMPLIQGEAPSKFENGITKLVKFNLML